jgi:hypothetical protein
VKRILIGLSGVFLKYALPRIFELVFRLSIFAQSMFKVLVKNFINN